MRMVVFVALTCLSVAVVPARASVLGSFWLEATIGYGPVAPSSLSYGLTVGPSSVFWESLTPADSGRSFTADALTNPAFADIVATLTNGVDDSMSQTIQIVRLISTLQGSEQGTFFPYGGGPDFAGDTISSLVLNIDQLSIADGSVDFHCTLDVMGTAPEPLCFAPVGVALMLLATFRRAQARRRWFSPIGNYTVGRPERPR